MSSLVEVTPELMAGFLDEAPEYLAMLDEGLLAFESKAGEGVISLTDAEDQERMNEMFRAAHSLKGLGAAMGFDKIRDLTHLMETLFDHVRMGKKALDPGSFETLFKVFDNLRELVEELTNPPAEPVTIDVAIKALEDILSQSDSAPPPESEPAASDSNVPDSTESASVAGESATTSVGLDPELMGLFIATTSETIDALNDGLLKLEQKPDDPDLLNEIFRCAHNIKGATGTTGFDGLCRFTHSMETVLDRLRSDSLKLDESLVNALFGAVDHIRSELDLIKAGKIEELTGAGAENRFAAWLGAENSAVPTSDGIPPKGPIGGEDGGDVVVVTVTFEKDFAESEIQAYLIHNKLGELGTILDTTPDIESFDGSTTIEHLVFRVAGGGDPASIEEIVGGYAVKSVNVQREGAQGSTESPAPANTTTAAANTASTPTKSPAETTGRNISKPIEQPGAPPQRRESAPTGNKAPAAKASETIRVDLERLDQLMNLGGELVINKARFAQIQSRIESMFTRQNLSYLVDDMSDRLKRLNNGVAVLTREASDVHLATELSDTTLLLTHDFDIVKEVVRRVHDSRGAMNDFAEALHSLNRTSEGIQKRIMETRMVSVGPLFQRFRRAVRDMAKSTHKDVDLILHGEATELDKRMIDELADPLTHMVRNSVDHGIETPEERVKCGKPKTGRVEMDAYHRGRHICIEVRDDGAGINVEAVKNKIVERELAPAAQVETMSDKEIIQYVLKPGFSTAAQVTDLSGRGMGMDIVINKIESLSGTVEIDSVPGEGTCVVIKLPLTLAIITALLARIGKGVYALPLETVGEIITVAQSNVQSIQGRRVVRVRDSVIPIALFEAMFRTNEPELHTHTRDDSTVTLVILSLGGEKLGLIVDELIGQEDIVIKNLAANYRNVQGVAGASIMGDGKVSLILDVAAMMSMFAERSAESVSSAESVDADTPQCEPSSCPSEPPVLVGCE